MEKGKRDREISNPLFSFPPPPPPSLLLMDVAAVRLRSSFHGEVHVIIGPMFAGKTTALLRRIQSERDNGRSVVMVKSSKDSRYGLDCVVTHDGKKMPCFAVPNLSTFRAHIGHETYNKFDVIGIDEGQFFEDLYDFCCEAADIDKKTIIIAGLDGDYMRYYSSKSKHNLYNSSKLITFC
ncbi:Thymidine kinase protein [Dioscorea alata]|uniref:Thymidine kinase protein n=1 Tax=Dioscorea alata TaxID=55571 RepID=A0ACB7UXN1_DIOAL|nr:Thymidine kinase protein [Dioscorea alata]